MIGVAILGSTGSIGRQTLDVVRQYRDNFRVCALVCGTDAVSLIKQAREFRPEFVGISDCTKGNELAEIGYKCDVFAGEEAQEIAASLPSVDIVVASVVGLNGLKGVIAAINADKRVALANKETLVACGKYVTELAAKKRVEILPVDSEHSAIFQCLGGGKKEDLKRLVLTASGGPFRSAKTREELSAVTPEQAVRHPNWSMGKKISVDSATMMNKGLEIIEARWLFGTENIDYIIQPESIIHSMVEFNDGTVVAQIAPTDMTLPIQFALTYPNRVASRYGNYPFDKPITFIEPNEELFPMPKLAKVAMREGGTAPAILNAANEAAVALFLSGKICFTDIMSIVAHILDTEKATSYDDYREIIELHKRVYGEVIRDYTKLSEIR